MQTEFYNERRLPTPKRELRPDSPRQLIEAVASLDADEESWRLVGGGHHARPASDDGWNEDDYVAIRTANLDRILEFDAKSGLVRVGAGIHWNQLDAELVERDCSLQRYGLHPPTATIGGMLARHRSTPTMLRGGELLDGCVAAGAHHPATGEYRYLAAPRKASGPDLRHMLFGAGHSGAVLLDATLVVWPPVASRLVCYDGCSPSRAADIVSALFEAALTPTWVHYGWSNQALQFELAVPGQLLRARMRWLENELGEPKAVGDGEDARTRKRWLQSRHPNRRNHPAADRTRIFSISTAALPEEPTQLFGEGVDDVEILSWTPRRATAYVRYENEDQIGGAVDAPPEGACWASREVLA